MCRILTWLFALLYIAALALLLIGTFGLFGNDRDPLSGVFLVPLGLPWNLMVDWTPETLWPYLAAASPALNLLLISVVCRWLKTR